jgi:hypothetical protein
LLLEKHVCFALLYLFTASILESEKKFELNLFEK